MLKNLKLLTALIVLGLMTAPALAQPQGVGSPPVGDVVILVCAPNSGPNDIPVLMSDSSANAPLVTVGYETNCAQAIADLVAEGFQQTILSSEMSRVTMQFLR